MKVQPYFSPREFWVGIQVMPGNVGRRLYVHLFPCLGVMFCFGERSAVGWFFTRLWRAWRIWGWYDVPTLTCWKEAGYPDYESKWRNSK
jgi:hypothetical protein